MKKLFLLSILSGTMVSLTAQKAKVQSASNYLKYDELDKAKEAIDLASEHADTKTLGKTWFYKGKVYLALLNTKEEKFKALAPNAAEVAYNAFLKAFELNDKKVSKTDLNNNFAQLINPVFNKGIEAFKAKDYKVAGSLFEKTTMINQKLGLTDTLSIYNTGLSYANAGENAKAEISYKKCLDLGYGGDKMFTTMADLMVKDGKKDAAVEFLKNEGLKKYPNNQNILNYVFSIYLNDNDFDGALASVNSSLENEPNNAVFHYNKGFLLDQKKAPANEVLESYQKAIELDPNYFDAYYNAGALYFNNGANKIKERNELPLNEAKKAKTLENQAMEDFKKALPFLEKAHHINPSDKPTLKSLKELYVRLNMNDKVKEINDKLSN